MINWRIQSYIASISTDKNNGKNNKRNSCERSFRARSGLHQYLRSCMGISTQILLKVERKPPKREDVVNLDEVKVVNNIDLLYFQTS